MAGPAGVHAVIPLELEAFAILGAGLMALHEHRPIDIGERDLLGLRDLDADVAEVEQREVELLPGALGGLHPRRDGMDRARRAEHDACAGFLELTHDGGLVRAIGRGDGVVLRHIAEIVHAVTGGRDGRLETQDVVVHALEETAGLLAAPAILADGDMEVGASGDDVGLHQQAVHLLLSDGVAADREAVALLQERRRRLRREPADILGGDDVGTGLGLLATDQAETE